PFQANGDPSADPSTARSSYVPNHAAFGHMWANTRRRYPASFTDGTGNTIAFQEAYSYAWGNSYYARSYTTVNAYWSGNFYLGYYQGGDETPARTYTVSTYIQFQPSVGAVNGYGAQSFSSAGLQVAMFDGSVRT